MPGHDTTDKEGEGRSNPTALLRHMDREIRQMEQEAFPEDWYPDHRKEEVGCLRRTPLQKANNRIENSRRKRNHKEEKQQAKGNHATDCHPEAEQKYPPAHHHERQYRHCQVIRSPGRSISTRVP